MRAIYRVAEFARFLEADFLIPEVYQYLFDALPILACTLGFSIILPWQLDYKKAVGDVLEKVEWGLLAPIVWPLKKYIRQTMANRAEKRAQGAGEQPPCNDSTQELSDMPK